MDKPLHVQVAEALGCKPRMMPDPHGAPAWLCLCEDEHRPIYRRHGEKGNADLLRYDTDWSATGPQIEKYALDLRATPWQDGTKEWEASAWRPNPNPKEAFRTSGDTPLIAVCNLILKLKEAGRL